MKALITSLRAIWQARAARERQALLAMVVVIVGAIVLQLSWTAWQQREPLRRQIPLRQMELATLQRQAEELQRPKLPATAASPLAGDALAKVLRSEIDALGATLALKMSAPRRIDIRGDVDFDGFITWLARAQQAQRLRVMAAEIKSSGLGNGRVSLSVELGDLAD